ncbi:MAG: response regulator transcription factor [Acidimicrobiia bacterium]
MSAVGTRILLVEDDHRIRRSLGLFLEDEGNTVDQAVTAEDGLSLFGQHDPDVVIVDLVLPGMNGFDLCRHLRSSGNVPILILTARSDSHDVVAGLEAGADDYVVKPVVPKELAARVRALVRRATRTSVTQSRLTFGDVELLPDAGVVKVRGEEVSLTRTEFRLLCELAQSPGRLLSREVLLDRVWDYDYFGDSRLVDVHIRRLRTKIEPDPAHPRHILTARGLGYRFAP